MRTQACLGLHNSHMLQQDTDWSELDIRDIQAKQDLLEPGSEFQHRSLVLTKTCCFLHLPAPQQLHLVILENISCLDAGYIRTYIFSS
jgi:hypothetical protein